MVIDIPQIENEETRKLVESQVPVKNEPVESGKSNAVPTEHSPSRPKYAYSVQGYEYQKEELFLKYQSKDGDTLELSYSSERLSAFSGELKTDDPKAAATFQKMMDKIEEYIGQQQQKMLDVIFGALNGKEQSVVTPVLGSGQSPELAVPEYWNAENTSQRIVDFATSFFDIAGMEGSEYGEMMIEAVKKGFEEANEMLGNLPGPVGELIADTQQLTMDKLDAWMAEHSNYAVAA